jgi:hypothetical protein
MMRVRGIKVFEFTGDLDLDLGKPKSILIYIERERERVCNCEVYQLSPLSIHLLQSDPYVRIIEREKFTCYSFVMKLSQWPKSLKHKKPHSPCNSQEN